MLYVIIVITIPLCRLYASGFGLDRCQSAGQRPQLWRLWRDEEVTLQAWRAIGATAAKRRGEHSGCTMAAVARTALGKLSSSSTALFVCDIQVCHS
jgi:hypothetical protein